MSIKTTYLVTREFALAAIQKRLDDLSDDELSDVLETVLHNGFYNFWIVSEEDFNKNLTDNDNYTKMRPYLDDLENLPEHNDAR